MFSKWRVPLCFALLGIARGQDNSGLEITRDLLRQGQYAMAAQELSRLELRHDLTDAQRFDLGWLYGQAHEFRKALATFRSVPSNIPDAVTHAFATALAQVQLGEFDDAAHTLEPVSEDPAFGPKQANLLGVAYSKTGKIQKALALFEAQTGKHPADPAAFLNLTTLLCENGKKAECVNAAARAVHAFPTSAQAHLVLGAAYRESGAAVESRAEFAAAHRLEPAAAEPAFFLALADYQAQDFSSAIATLRASTASGTRDADLYYLLAECLLHEEVPQETQAFAALNQAIAISSQSAPARTLRAKLSLGKGDYRAAAADLETALAREPESRTALYLLSRTYQSMGRQKEAQELRARIRSSASDDVATLAAARVNAVLAGGQGRQ